MTETELARLTRERDALRERVRELSSVKAELDGEYCCGVCGRRVKVREDLSHRCPPRTLAGIDGADSRASAPQPEFWRGYPERLEEGVRLMLVDADGETGAPDPGSLRDGDW